MWRAAAVQVHLEQQFTPSVHPPPIFPAREARLDRAPHLTSVVEQRVHKIMAWRSGDLHPKLAKAMLRKIFEKAYSDASPTVKREIDAAEARLANSLELRGKIHAHFANSRLSTDSPASLARTSAVSPRV